LEVEERCECEGEQTTLCLRHGGEFLWFAVGTKAQDEYENECGLSDDYFNPKLRFKSRITVRRALGEGERGGRGGQLNFVCALFGP
jgi:hypothetical protein